MTDTAAGGPVRRVLLLAAALWAVVVLAGLLARPLLPVDETRYVSVAWGMWLRGAYLVPHLNGAPYSHKPPLLFWLITAGWGLTGPSLAWARLVGPLCAAADLILAVLLARRLWPSRPLTARLAPLLLVGTLLWTVYGGLLLFDALLTACVLVALLGLVDLRAGRRYGFLLLAAGIGFGVLAKGPVVLLHVLPPALLAWWWAPPATGAAVVRARWGGWVLAGVLAGAALALCWAIPAAITGGPVYGREIFLGQTAGRMVRSFAHRRPVYWYLPQLFWILLPWWCWPTIWRALGRLRGSFDGGARFCVAWAVPALVAFSLVSGKQVHYLLPELPAMALLLARALDGWWNEAAAREPTSGDIRWPAAVLALPGAAVLAARLLGPRVPVPAGVVLPAWWVALLLFAVPPVIALLGRRGDPVRRIGSLAAATASLVVVLQLGVLPGVTAPYDVAPISARLGALDRAGVPIAHVGEYAGQYTFLGRLRHPVAIIENDSVASWLAAHPGGRVIDYARRRTPGTAVSGPGVIDFVQPYRKGVVVLRRAATPPPAADTTAL